MLAWHRTALRRSVVVNLRTDKAFRGVLFAARGPLLILKNAVLIEPGREAIKVDGDVVVERSAVDFVQVLNPEV